MKALVRDRYGSIDDLHLRDIPTPAPGDGEVLIRVRAASINDWDLALIKPQPLLLRPLTSWLPIVGSDVAGVVEAVGAGATRFRPGDEVYGDLSRFGRGGWGAFAEHVCASETALIPKPAGMTFEQAAAIPQAGVLALLGVRAGGQRLAGKRILINGAGGGVGTFAVQLLKSKGAELTGVDSAVKVDLMRSLGFDRVIDYAQQDFTRGAERYDLIVDTKTTRSPFAYPRALNPGGTYATVGGLNKRLLQLVICAPVIRRTSRKTLRLVMLKQNQDLSVFNDMFEAGTMRPVIDGPYPLSDAHRALRHFEAGRHKGKVIITMD